MRGDYHPAATIRRDTTPKSSDMNDQPAKAITAAATQHAAARAMRPRVRRKVNWTAR